MNLGSCHRAHFLAAMLSGVIKKKKKKTCLAELTKGFIRKGTVFLGFEGCAEVFQVKGLRRMLGKGKGKLLFLFLAADD